VDPTQEPHIERFVAAAVFSAMIHQINCSMLKLNYGLDIHPLREVWHLLPGEHEDKDKKTNLFQSSITSAV
jgi:hypothetical protein